MDIEFILHWAVVPILLGFSWLAIRHFEHEKKIALLDQELKTTKESILKKEEEHEAELEKIHSKIGEVFRKLDEMPERIIKLLNLNKN